jgi:hypothetical protein
VRSERIQLPLTGKLFMVVKPANYRLLDLRKIGIPRIEVGNNGKNLVLK